MKYDKPLIVILVAILATIPGEISTRILLHFGVGDYSLYQLDSLVMTEPPDVILGFIVCSLVAGTVAILLYYISERLGSDHIVIKSSFLSILAWGILEYTFTAAIEDKFIPTRSLSDHYVNLCGVLVFGITLGLLFRFFVLKKPLPWRYKP